MGVAAHAMKEHELPEATRDTFGRDSAALLLLAHIEQLIHLLEAADAAFRNGSGDDREQALFDGLSAIGELYGVVQVGRSPETAGHLEAVFDACIRALGDAYGGDVEALAAAVTMARAIRTALRPPAPSPGVTGMRRAA